MSVREALELNNDDKDVIQQEDNGRLYIYNAALIVFSHVKSQPKSG